MSIAQINRRFTALYLAVVCAAIGISLYLAPSALAAGSKGGGSVSKAGDNAADLIGGIAGPILIVVVGVVAVTAMAQRQIATAFAAGLCALFAGWFLFSPDTVETTFNGVYKAIF